jgi:hypothetical protein
VDELKEEARNATELLSGKVVRTVWRHRAAEVGIEFTDGTRLFVDANGNSVELSITGNVRDDDGGSLVT